MNELYSVNSTHAWEPFCSIASLLAVLHSGHYSKLFAHFVTKRGSGACSKKQIELILSLIVLNICHDWVTDSC